MTANLFLFLMSIAIGAVVSAAFGLWRLGNKGVFHALDNAFGCFCMLSGLAVGTLAVCVIFAFAAGWFTGR